MADYFTSEHFKLLNRWKGQLCDRSNPEQGRAYESLKQAYDVLEQWATDVQRRLFPQGSVELTKRPTNRVNKFMSWVWARIYPYAAAPRELAYTLGIDADNSFFVDIDTYRLDDSDLKQKAYLALRGSSYHTAPFAARLSANHGLEKSMPELVDWTVQAIRGFKMRYAEVAARMELVPLLSDDEVLAHFDGNSAFRDRRAQWSSQTTAMFCSFARVVHEAGLDWWHLGNRGRHLRFGRKHPGSERATGVLGAVHVTRVLKYSLYRSLGKLPQVQREELRDEVFDDLDAALQGEQHTLEKWWPLDVERPGLWPDDLRDDPSEVADEVDDGNDKTSSQENFAKQSPPVNRIYYGPPGTGKTYKLSQLLKQDYEQPVQSVSLDVWRRQFIIEKFSSLPWWKVVAAALIDIEGPAKLDKLLEHEFVRLILMPKCGEGSAQLLLWDVLKRHSVVVDGRTGYEPPTIFNKSENLTWNLFGKWREICKDLIGLVKRIKVGPPAAGNIQECYSFVTFHQSYGYEEFVEGLRPKLAEGEAESGAVEYEIRQGAFKQLCSRARLAPHQRFAMVIDEINRGNISKIFGELITLIETDKRDPLDGSRPPVEIELAYSGQKFSVPANVDILGTMNTADRSLALLDTALRRRFEFVPCMPDTRDAEGAPLAGLVVNVDGHRIDVRLLLQRVNERIEALYDRDHTIGHAYFTALRDVEDGPARFEALAQVFRHKLLPLLEEYFFEDWHKIRLVLADNQKEKLNPATCFVTVLNDADTGLDGLFGSEHGLDAFATRKRHALQEAAFDDPRAYVGVYDASAATRT